MDHAHTLVQQHFGTQGGEIVLSGVPVSQIVAQYGTPLFIYDQHVLDKKWALLRAALPPEFRVYYSVKANPHPALLRYFLTKGCGLEIASGGEFTSALQVGCDAEHMVFAGPGKTPSELELVLGHAIRIFQSGAYARTASPLGFLSHSSPPEVWVENGTARLIRRRSQPDAYNQDVVEGVVETEPKLESKIKARTRVAVHEGDTHFV